MIIGYFDYIVFGVFLFLNIRLWKQNYNQKIGCLLGILILGLILPLISMIIEINSVEETIGIMNNEGYDQLPVIDATG